jgi:putative transposase
MLPRLFRRCAHLSRSLARTLRQRLISATKPAEQGVAVGALTDLVRGRPALIAENAFLRQQLLILRRQARRPRGTAAERALLVLLASRLRTWRHALLLVQPDTLLRRHRHLFRWSWRRRVPFRNHIQRLRAA